MLGGLCLSTSIFAKCPPDSIYKVVYVTVETRVGDTLFIPDVDSIAEIPSACAITKYPSIGSANIEGHNLIYISETDRLGRDTMVCGLSTSQGVKYVKFIYHIINNSGMGRDFWFAFLEIHDEYPYHQQIDIVALQETNVTIQTEAETKTVTIPENGWYQYLPATDLSCKGSETVQQKAIHITADHPISVVSAQLQKASIDITAILPTEALGTKYITMLQDTIWSSEICVVASQPTDVDIYPSQQTIGGVSPGGRIHVHLNQGQTFQVQSGRGEFTRVPSLAGTRIVSTKPVAVFEGTMCTDYPVDWGCCDHNYEQSLPTKYWGTRYVYVRLCVTYDRFRITAMEDSTVITKNGEYFTTLNANESYIGFIFEDAAVFEANAPIAMSQYMTSTALNEGGYGDPAILNVRPIEAGIQHVIFSVPNGIIINDKKYTKLNVVATLDAIDSLTLDGHLLDFDPIIGYDSLYYAVIKGLDFGLHELKTPSGKFIATCVGAAVEETYCFIATTSFEAVRDTLVQIEASICENESYYFAGQCLDKTGIYFDTVYSPNWRDSVVELHLTVYPSYEYETDTVVTYWSSLDWRDHHLTNIIHDTLIIDSLQTIEAGCDSIYILNLTAQCAKVDTFITDTSLCSNQWPYIWHTYREVEIQDGGTFMDSIRGYKCDSIYYILHIEKIRSDSIDTTVFVCRKDLPYHWGGQSISEEGIYTAILDNQLGCDSVVTLTVYITSFCDITRPIDPMVDCIDTTYSTTDTTMCDSELRTDGFEWFGNRYYEAGEYHDTLIGQNYLNCDSVGTLYLKTIPCSCDTAYSHTYTNIKEVEVPQFQWNGIPLNTVPHNARQDTALVYPTIKADASCDSIATLHLHVLFPCELPTETLPLKWGGDR